MSNLIAKHNYLPSNSMSVTKTGLRSFLMASCLTLPLVAKIFLPSSLENSLTLQMLGIPVFLPNLLLFVFFANSQKNHGNKGLKTIFWLQFLFMVTGFVYNRYSEKPMAFLLAGNYYYYIIMLGLYCRIKLQERYWVSRILTFTLLFLGIQVVLLGMGIIKGLGSIVVAESSQEFEDFFRVATTAGPSTCTAVHLYMLTVICVMLSDSAKWRYFLVAFGLSTTVLTISRGGSTTFIMYLLLWFYFKMKERRNTKKIKVVFGVLTSLFLLYAVGVFNPILKRVEIKAQNETQFESREDRAQEALFFYQRADSKLLGLGIANLYRSSEIQRMGYENVTAPHNSYVQTLCEQGVIGLALMLLFWIVFVVINRSNKAILISIIPLLLVSWNTESSIVVLSDFIVSLSIFMMLALDRARQNQLNTM